MKKTEDIEELRQALRKVYEHMRSEDFILFAIDISIEIFFLALELVQKDKHAHWIEYFINEIVRRSNSQYE